MKFTYLIILFQFIALYGASQNLTILNKADLQPIHNVYLTGNGGSITTNPNGIADISCFKRSDSIHVSHPSFITIHTTYADLKKADFTLLLTKSMMNLNEVIVSASKWKQCKTEVSAKITQIDKKEIAFENPQTSADLLASTGEVFIQKSQLGGGSPMIRGFASNRVLLVIDGVRMNNAIYRYGNLQNVISIDPSMTESAEVIFGPGSVMYGSDALGGVMHFRSIKPRFSYDDKTIVHADALARYSSANNEKTGHLSFQIGGRNWASATSISYSNFGDLKMGTVGHEEYQRPEYVDQINGVDSIVANSNPNVQKYSGYSQLNAMQKLRYAPNHNWDIMYSFHYSSTSDVPRYDRLIQYSGDKLKYAEWYYGPQKWMMNNLQVSNTQRNTMYDKLRFTVAHQAYEESRHDRKLNKNLIRERTEKVNMVSANLDLQKKINSKMSVFYGAEAVHNLISSTGHQRSLETSETTPYASRYPDGSTYSSVAAYSQVNYTLNDRIKLNGGIRYSHVMLEATFDTTFYRFPFSTASLSNGNLNGSLGAVFQITNSCLIKVNASSGFRAPNMDDVGKIFDSEPGNVIVPNPDLESEYSYNLDLGIAKTFNDRVQVELTGFYTLLQNAMVRRDYSFNGMDSIMYDGEMSKVQALVNTDQAYIYGVQASIYADLSSRFFFRSSINLTDGEDKEGFPVRHVAPTFGTTHLIYKVKKLNIDVYAVYNGEISNDNLALDEQGKTYMYASDENGLPYAPSWWTLNAKCSYQIHKNLQVNAGIENILDKRYRPYSSGIVAPGRNFILALRLHI